MRRRIAIEPDQKALEINLDPSVYGTFSEIGAGQEVARHFFQVGAAAGTIAKTMSAYDKKFSDSIYGGETSNRYVSEGRLYKMLDHEYDLIDERLTAEKPNTKFFVFADTVAAINYHRTIKGHGWLGIRFQSEPGGETNEVVLHVKMLDQNNKQQQEAVGILGVNLVYACFRYSEDVEEFIVSLQDTLKDRIKIDMMRFTGPAYNSFDNRLAPLMLVKNGLCDVSMFNTKGESVHCSEFLYRKEILVVRGKYRPLTLKGEDMYEKAVAQFSNEADANAEKVFTLTELTLEALQDPDGNIDYEDYLHRTSVLCKMGRTVMVSNCENHAKLIEYLKDVKPGRLGVAMGVKPLTNIVDRLYENNNNYLIAAFGELFAKHVKLYIYPSVTTVKNKKKVLTVKNIPIPTEIKFLYKHLLENRQVVGIEGYDEDMISVSESIAYDMIRQDKQGWHELVSKEVLNIIKKDYLFGFPVQKFEFEY